MKYTKCQRVKLLLLLNNDDRFDSIVHKSRPACYLKLTETLKPGQNQIRFSEVKPKISFEQEQIIITKNRHARKMRKKKKKKKQL